MKDPNVLEAKNLCVNGNPVDRPVFSDSEVYRIICLFQTTSSAFQELSNAFRKLGRVKLGDLKKKSWIDKIKKWVRDLFIDDYENAMKEHAKNMSFLNNP